MWWEILAGIAIAILATWLLLILGLLIARPERGLLGQALRILPDLLRLLRRLAADTTLPRGIRIRLGLLMAYLAVPFDLIPDFIPVLGYADDAIIVTLVLRSVVRRAGLQVVRRHWPGTLEGFAVLCRLAGIAATGPTPDATGSDPGEGPVENRGENPVENRGEGRQPDDR